MDHIGGYDHVKGMDVNTLISRILFYIQQLILHKRITCKPLLCLQHEHMGEVGVVVFCPSCRQ